MKTLIFTGSPRKNGNCAFAVQKIKESLNGETEIIDSYALLGQVKPCIDCRYCWKNPSCAIKTDIMHSIYDKIEKAHNIIIVSPLYFASVPGPMKTIIDRLQVYWSCHIRGDGRNENTKNGFNVVIGGAPEYENQFLATDLLVNNVFKDLFVNNLGSVHFADSDMADIKNNDEFLSEISLLTNKLNHNLIETDARPIIMS